MGFFLCFCSNSINFSFSLFTIVPWSFVPRGCYWQLWSTKREERWLVATASYIWILSCFHPGSPSLNVLFSLVECTASNYSLVEIFVKLFWRWNCHELSCGNIHLAGVNVDGYDVGATVEDGRDFWVKEFIRWLYAASYRDHQLRYEFFFSVHSADSFFQKWNIVGDLRVLHSVHIVPAADYKIIIFFLSVKYSHARTTI